MGFKDLFLQKGWAGRTLSRQETIEHLSPLLRRHHELNHYYTYAARHLADGDTAARLNERLKIARADVGKLSETILSCGGVSYSGTELEPGAFTLGPDKAKGFQKLQTFEQELQDAVSAELDRGDHQMRTRAILAVVQTNSRARLDLLSRLLRTQRRAAPSP